MSAALGAIILSSVGTPPRGRPVNILNLFPKSLWAEHCYRVSPPQNPPGDLKCPTGAERQFEAAVGQPFQLLRRVPLPLGHVGSLVGPEPQDHIDGFLPNHAKRFLSMPVQVMSRVHGERISHQLDFADAVDRKGCEAIAGWYLPHAVEGTGDVQQAVGVEWVRFWLRAVRRSVGDHARPPEQGA